MIHDTFVQNGLSTIEDIFSITRSASASTYTKTIQITNKGISGNTIFESYVSGNIMSQTVSDSVGNLLNSTSYDRQSNGAYTKIYLLNDKTITLGKNLKYFENLIGDKMGFFRSHRAWMVNLKHVKSVNKTDLCLFLPNGLMAKIARTQYNAFECAIK